MTISGTPSKPGSGVRRDMGRMIGVGVLSLSFVLGTSVARAQDPAVPPAPGPAPGMPADAPPVMGATPPPPGPPPMPADLPAPVGAPSPAPAPMATPVPPPWTVPPAPMMAEPSRLPSYLMWGVGGASLVFGAAFGIAALSAKKDFDDAPTYGRADSVHQRAILADVGLGLGLILAVTGTIFYFGHDGPAESPQAANNHPRSSTQVAVAPLVGWGSGGGMLAMRF
jgi:hypothetical protein